MSITDLPQIPINAPAENQYHLYIALTCPWAHRANLGRSLMGLHQAITISIVDPQKQDGKWAFTGASVDLPKAAIERSNWHIFGIKSRNFKLQIRAESQNLALKYGSRVEFGMFGIF